MKLRQKTTGICDVMVIHFIWLIFKAMKTPDIQMDLWDQSNISDE